MFILITKKDIVTLNKGVTQSLDDTALISEAECCSNFTEYENKFCLNLHCNRSNSIY